MPNVSSTSSTATSQAAASGSKPLVNPGGILDKDDFLKLFVAQLQHQDPMAPMGNDQMVQQMSALSSVEQLSNMATSNAQMAQAIGSSHAIGLIGRTVTWTGDDDVVHTGTVEKVTTADGVPSLTVAGTPGVNPSSITQVA
jgi:flagellar basal-body rod modification protein FlgD